MQQLHDKEIEDAKQRLSDSGRDPGDYTFDLAFMPPDPDGGGMFTLRYEITVSHNGTGKTSSYIGGIGLDWVEAFEHNIEEGTFD